MTPHRPQDWPTRLDAHLAHHASTPFRWGSHDCVHFAAGWLELLGYPDPLAPFAAWRSALGAARVIRAHGSFSAAIVCRMHEMGCPILPVAAAQRGDLALVQIDRRRQALGIVVGAHVAIPADAGLARFPVLQAAVCAWSV